jgi:hypothetical protein
LCSVMSFVGYDYLKTKEMAMLGEEQEYYE